MTLTVSGRWGDLIKDLIGDGPSPNRSCEHCDKDFYGTRADHRYCSRSCKQMAWKKLQPKKPLPPLNCATCGVVMIQPRTTGARPKTCSEVCKMIRDRSYKSRQVVREKKAKPRPCPVCQTIITTPMRRTCSEVCNLIHKANK